MHPKSQIICSLNSHNIFLQNSLNFNIPINSLFEKESLLLNVEGRVQKSFKVITPNKNSRNSEDFFKVLLKLNKKINKTLFLNQTLFLEAPFLKILNKNLRTESFYYNFFLFKEFEQKLKFSSFKQTIPNFYLTNNFCKNSKIMSECALFLTNKSNFF